MLDDNMSLENEQSNDLPLISDVGYNLESAQASALSSLSETAQALTVAINKIAAYVPTQWVNGTEPDIDEDNLNKIEEGIKNATNAVNSSIDAITELAAAVDTLNGKIDNKGTTIPINGCFFKTIYTSNKTNIHFSFPSGHTNVLIFGDRNTRPVLIIMTSFEYEILAGNEYVSVTVSHPNVTITLTSYSRVTMLSNDYALENVYID